MNAQTAILFIIFILYFSFSIILFYVSKKLNKKGLSYLYINFMIKAAHVLPPVLFFFNLDITYAAYITAPLKVSLLPLYFLYLKKLRDPDKKLKKREYLHLLPTLAELILSLAVAPNHSKEIMYGIDYESTRYMEMFIENNFYYNLLSVSARIIGFTQAFVYTILIYFLYKEYSIAMRNEVSEINNRNLKWIGQSSVIFGIECVFAGIDLFGLYTNQLMFIISFLYLIFFGFYFFVHSLIQPDISFIGESLSSTEKKTIRNEQDELPAEDYFPKNDRFLEQFNQQQLYLEKELTLQKVSDELGIAKYKITSTIKDAGYKNFYDFVNRHRINHSIKLLEELPSSYSLESVGVDSGFKGRSTFYRVFKEVTGETPSNFVKNQR
ncbi:helix-turn-helix domain-containing protein [Sunxiuqinia elliptica]|uniref:AraC-like DNA-binding protein n=1 Tax=Sunxiuqinia elliptica TaxID=655355 RepID=A0A4R6H7P3_9BACT|nr:helix-turn-helix domain-containing protein [Sunxiuqinia elliptica]TDO03977.1 AraC-like DNA-binding protein [Sunxiuqinia elliptica]TDO62259.1 AraC-like DNA-binding protein [Sunxiuqinia elliptica]